MNRFCSRGVRWLGTGETSSGTGARSVLGAVPGEVPGVLGTGWGEGLEQLAQTVPARRAALPSEIAEAVVYLASDEANFVHGATFPVDGGRIAI